MEETNIPCNKINLKSAQSGNEFVGLKIMDGEKFITFPMGHRTSEKEITVDSLTKTQRKEILNLITTISSCKKLKEGQRVSSFNNKKTASAFPIRAMFFIIEDFLDSNSYYTEKEILYTYAQNGKISWNRTIKNIKPTVSENGIAYLDFIIRKNHIQENQLITELHKYCVYKCFELLGFLYASFLPEKGQLSENDIAKNKKSFLVFLQEKIDSTHLEQNLELFTAMYEFIEKYSATGELNNATYGTQSFQTVWEDMVEKLFSTVSRGQKEKYFYPHTKWSFKKRRQAPLRPDTIMILGEKCFILDSKYYSYSALENEDDENGDDYVNGSIPGSDSIQKQITYAQFIDSSMNNNGGKYPRPSKFRFAPENIYNVFILPANNGEKIFDHKGYATSEWQENNKNYHFIHAVTMDTEFLMRNYGRNGEEVKWRLAEMVENTTTE